MTAGRGLRTGAGRRLGAGVLTLATLAFLEVPVASGPVTAPARPVTTDPGVGPVPPGAAASPGAANGPAATTVAATSAPAGVVPTAVTVPALGVESALVPVGLDAAGALQVPADPGTPGWFTGSVVPGERGPAVLAGHVDSRTGPAVFFGLATLRPGDEVVVARSDGLALRFLVDRVEQHDKGAFPTAAVYGPTSARQLRLVTCGGEFDRDSGHYVDNVVVFASLPTAPGTLS